MRAFKIIALIVALVGIAAHAGAQRMTRAEYIERFRHVAVSHMEKYGIPASIKMAQGLLESDNGNSRLATEGNNHFGIKCKAEWRGSTIHHDDDEANECFRAYSSGEESWADHSEFLDKGERYQFLFALDPTDYKAWAQGLSAAGYATNPRYPELLIQIIEDNRLYLLDRGVELPLGDLFAREQTAYGESVPASALVNIDSYIVTMNNLDGRGIFRTSEGLFIIAQNGDTLSSLAGLAGVRPRRLARRNKIEINTPLIEGQQIRLE